MGGEGSPQITENRTPGKSTQNHLTTLVKASNVISGWEDTPSQRIEEPPRGATRGVQQLNRKEVIVMTIGELIGLASVVLTLPGSIVAVIQLWQMLRPGHGQHRK